MARRPDVTEVALTVAEALREAGLVSVGAEALSVEAVGDTVQYALAGVSEKESALFATSLVEALSPISDPRYVISRPVVERATLATALRALATGVVEEDHTWHPIPAVLAGSRSGTNAFESEWSSRIAERRVVLAKGTTEGVGIVTASRGADPWRYSPVIRVHWR